VIKLSKEFVDYLLSDGIILPKRLRFILVIIEFSKYMTLIQEINNCLKMNLISSDSDAYENSDEWSDDNNEDDNQSNGQNDPIEFPELEERMRQIMTRFGSVFPKLNWSSCQDSRWIIASGTRCTQLSDIYLLLKSSDNIVHDLTEP